MYSAIASTFPRVNTNIHCALDQDQLDVALHILKMQRPRVECTNDYALYVKLYKLEKVAAPLIEQVRGRIFTTQSAKKVAYIQYAIDQKLKRVEFEPFSKVTDADLDQLTSHNCEITSLKITGSSQLQNCGEALDRLIHLEELIIDHCPKFEGSIDCSKFPQLRKLDLRFCQLFTQLKNLACATQLEVFSLFFCYKFDAELDFQKALHIKDINIIHCNSMRQPIKLMNATTLQKFSLCHCPLFNHPLTFSKAINLKQFSLIANASFNQSLDFSDMDSLSSENCEIEECGSLDINKLNAIKIHFSIKEFEETIEHFKSLQMLQS